MIRSAFAAVLFSAIAGSMPAAAPATFSSGSRQVALIELFTSEGCSSCPPAEQWLGGLRDDVRLWKEFVPVAWHVVYWDRLGWRDAFASKVFTDRQYDLAESWKSDSVYTPCFARNAIEWRTRDLARGRPAEVGLLKAEVQAGGSVRVEFRPVSALTGDQYEAHAVLLGGGITSDVRAGENAGRKLAHEFVALRLVSAPLESADDGAWRATVRLDESGVPPTPRRALAVWVTPRGKLVPLQATGGWLE